MSFNKKIFAFIVLAIYGFCTNAQADDETCVVVLNKDSVKDLDAMLESMIAVNQCLGDTTKKFINTENLLELKGRFNKLQQKYNIPEADFKKIVQLLEKNDITEKGVAEIRALLQKYGITQSQEEIDALLEDLQ